MSTRHVVLRNQHDADGGWRHLDATVTAKGDVCIEGQDVGDEVERLLGAREYEWAWTIRAQHVPALLAALNATDGVIAALKRRFSDDQAAGLKSFLDEHDIPHESWSRMGD